MQTLMIYSEAGGVTKTTTAVSLAMTAAEAGRRVVLVDLDPRAAASTWLRAEPRQRGYHAATLLAHDDGAEWITELVVPSSWSTRLSVIPSDRALSTREEVGSPDGGVDLRLRRALHGLAATADVVILDLPNRQGGPITRNALNAAQGVIYAANPTPDGVEGVAGARRSVDRFRAGRREIGAPEQITREWIVCGAWLHPAVPSTVDKAGIANLRETGLLVEPVIPHRAIVQECRAVGEWYGRYPKGRSVADAYAQIAHTITTAGHLRGIA